MLTNISSPCQQGNEHVHHTLGLHDLVQYICGADELVQGLACCRHEDGNEGRQHIVCKILYTEMGSLRLPEQAISILVRLLRTL